MAGSPVRGCVATEEGPDGRQREVGPSDGIGGAFLPLVPGSLCEGADWVRIAFGIVNRVLIEGARRGGARWVQRGEIESS